MRTPIIIANWKMHKILAESREFIEKFEAIGARPPKVEVVIASPFTALAPLRELLSQRGLKLAAQNMFYQTEGPLTGEISPLMLKDVGCEYVIVGHSERRQHFSESDDWVHKKAVAAIEHQLKPVVCIGETLDARLAGQTEKIVTRQLDLALEDVPPGKIEQIVIAYEPVWAIGTGETASPQDAQSVTSMIRQRIAKNWGAKPAEAIRILYGGSVKPENAEEILREPDIDGALVGGASLDPNTFFEIVQASARAKFGK